MLLSMESTSNRMSRLGKSLITDTELLSLDEIVAEIDAVTADDVAALAADLLRLDRLSAAGIGPSEARFRAAIERVNPAPRASARQREGRSSSGGAARSAPCSRPRSRRPGTSSSSRRTRRDVAVDFTRPDAVEENVRVALERACPGRGRDDRLRPGARGGAGPACTGCPSSTRRTSRSERC